MCSTTFPTLNKLNNKKRIKRDESGFTLVEMAIVVLIAGLILGPVMALYHQHLRQKSTEHTQDAVEKAEVALEGYLSMFGRYPCPAPLDAATTDADYGREQRDAVTDDCVADGVGIFEVTSANPDLAMLGEDSVFIGALPYRNAILDEVYTLDGEGHRLYYAVTGALTDHNLFSNAEGGINIRSFAGDDLLETPDTAHYVIIAPNREGAGRYAKSGVLRDACPADADLGENCDFIGGGGDAEFVMNEQTVNFDDRIVYRTMVEQDFWQMQVSNNANIHMKDELADTLLMGDNPDLDVATALPPNSVLYLDSPSGADPSEASLRVLDALSLSGTGEICDHTGNCFQPADIAGPVGLVCPAAQPYLQKVDFNNIHIADGDCTDLMMLSCPDNPDGTPNFIHGVNNEGEIVCSTEPPPPCLPIEKDGMCTARKTTLPETGHGLVQSAYDGTCLMFKNPGSGKWNPAKYNHIENNINTLAELEAYVADLNSNDREFVDCDLVRTNYQCWNSSWRLADKQGFFPRQEILREGKGKDVDDLEDVWASISPKKKSGHEFDKGKDIHQLSNYVPENPMALANPDDIGFGHYNWGGTRWGPDCWCRESYHIRTGACTHSAKRTVKVVQVYCPQTPDGHIDRIQRWPATGMSDKFCDCEDGPVVSEKWCDNHFPGLTQEQKDGIQGKVQITKDRTCHADGSVSFSSETANTDNCICPSEADEIKHLYCEDWERNTSGVKHNGKYVEEKLVRQWHCPLGVGNSINDNPDNYGRYQGTGKTYEGKDWNVAESHTCECDVGKRDTKEEKCYDHDSKTYGDIFYERFVVACDGDGNPIYDDWAEYDNTCRSCKLEPAGALTTTASEPGGASVGSDCDCYGGNKPCHQELGSDNYLQGTCECVKQ